MMACSVPGPSRRFNSSAFTLNLLIVSVLSFRFVRNQGRRAGARRRPRWAPYLRLLPFICDGGKIFISAGRVTPAHSSRAEGGGSILHANHDTNTKFSEAPMKFSRLVLTACALTISAALAGCSSDM